MNQYKSYYCWHKAEAKKLEEMQEHYNQGLVSRKELEDQKEKVNGLYLSAMGE